MGWGNRFPNNLAVIVNASANITDRIHALIPKQPTSAWLGSITVFVLLGDSALSLPYSHHFYNKAVNAHPVDYTHFCDRKKSHCVPGYTGTHKGLDTAGWIPQSRSLRFDRRRACFVLELRSATAISTKLTKVTASSFPPCMVTFSNPKLLIVLINEGLRDCARQVPPPVRSTGWSTGFLFQRLRAQVLQAAILGD